MESSAPAQAHGPALIRLLARISGAHAPPPPHALSARLAQWIEWPQAVALSAALDARPAGAVAVAVAIATVDEDECADVRAMLVDRIGGDRAFTAAPDAATPPDAAFYRQRYTALQQLMEAEIRHLRGRLRGRLAKQDGAVNRLAALDAVMEQALGTRERLLLAPLAELVATHCERLRQAALLLPDAAGTTPHASTRWHAVFLHDMQQLLLAELDLRLHPLHGLLAALRSTAPGSHGH